MANCKVNIEGASNNILKQPLNKIFNAYQLGKYTGLTNYLISTVFTKYIQDNNYTFSDFSNPEITNSIYEASFKILKNALIDQDAETYNENPDGFTKAISDIALDELLNLYENFDTFKEYHKLSNGIFKTDVESLESILGEEGNTSDDESQATVEETESKQEVYDKSSASENPYDVLMNEIKLLFKLLPKYTFNKKTKKAELFLNEEGLPEMCDDQKVFRLLLSKLNTTKDIQSFKNKLNNPQLIKLIPEIEAIKNVLKVDNLDSDALVLQFIKFYQTFSKPKIQIQSTYRDKRGNRYRIDEILGNINKIRDQWTNNFFTGNVDKAVKKYLQTKSSGRVFIDSNNFIEKEPETIKESLNFLSLIGINISRDLIEKENLLEVDNEIIKNAKRLFNTTKKILGDDYEITEPLKQLREGTEFIKGETTALRYLENLESKYSTLVPTLSARNAEGEIQYLISGNSHISISTYYLNASKTIDDLLKTSTFINLQFNPLYKASAILNSLYKNNKRTKSFLDLTLISGDKVTSIDELNKTSTKNIIEKGLSPKQKLVQDYNNMLLNGSIDIMRPGTSSSFFSITLIDKDGIKKPLFQNNFFKNSFVESTYVQDQLLRYLNAEIERIQSFQKKKEENPNLTDKYGEFFIFNKLSKELKEKLVEPIQKNSNLYKDFIKEYENILNNKFNTFKKLLGKYELESKLISTNVREEFIKKQGLSEDDLHRSFIFNTMIQNIEFNILYSGDGLFYKDIYKRLQGLSSTGDLALIDQDIQNHILNSSYIKRYSLSSKLGIPYRDNTETLFTKTLQDIKPRAGYFKSYSESHPNADIADGQGWINPDFMWEMSIRQGWGNEYTNAVFKYESFIFKRDIQKKKLNKLEQVEFDKLEKKILSDPDKYSASVLKQSYFGPVLNSTVDAKAFDKFSLAPLFPSFVKGHPKLEKLLKDMVSGQYSYVKYASAAKGFTTEVVKSLKNATPDIHSTQLLKSQIKPSNEVSIDTPIPTQLLKLIMGNMFDEGIAKKPEYQEYYNDYLHTLKGIQKEQAFQLLEDFGINKEGVDFQKLSNKLIKEAIRKGYNSNIIYSLQVKNNKFNIPLEVSGYYDEVLKLIGGIADRTLRRYKVNGGDFVLVTNGEMSPLKWYEPGKKCECRITLTKEFRKLLNLQHPDGKEIGTRERLNELLKNEDWRNENEKSITVVLDRVPTQELNSMDSAVVVEFISSTMGNVVILPDEIVVKSGSDYDYDKEKTIIPSLNDNGEYISFSEEPRAKIEERIKSLKAQRESINLDELTDKIRTLKKERTEEVQFLREQATLLKMERGEIIEEVKALIKLVNMESDPENYIQYSHKPSSDIFNDIFQIDVQTLNQELDRNIIDLYTKFQEIDKVFERISSTFLYYNLEKEGGLNNLFNEKSEKIDQRRAISKELRDNYSQLSNYFDNFSNRILEIYSKTITLPERFNELTRPNSNKEIFTIADEMAELTGISSELPQGDEIYDYVSNLNVFDILFQAKNMLGPYAVANTFQQLLATVGVNLNETYNQLKLNGDVKRVAGINNLIFTEDEINKMLKKGKYLTSSNTDIQGRDKQIINSQSINATADSTKDPKFFSLGLNWDTIGPSILLNKMRGLNERIMYFIGQPSIRYYSEMRRNGLTRQEAKLKLIERLDLYVVRETSRTITPKKYKDFSNDPEVIKINSMKTTQDGNYEIKYLGKERLKLNSGKDGDKFIYGFNDLMYMIDNQEDLSKLQIFTGKKQTKISDVIQYGNIDPNRLRENVKPKNDLIYLRKSQTVDTVKNVILAFSDEMKILASFFELEQVNYAFRDIGNYFNYDTKKVSSLSDIFQKKLQKEKIIKQKLISLNDFNKIQTDSIISAFINDETLESLYSSISPILSNNIVQEGFATLIKDYNSNFSIRNSKDARNLPIILVNDFMYSIVYNFGELAKKGYESIIQDDPNIITGSGIKTSGLGKLIDLKNSSDYEEVKEKFPIFEQLIASLQMKDESIVLKNIQLIKNQSLSYTEEESLIKQFSDLLDKDLSDNPVSNKKYKEIVKDIFNIALAQSGFSKSNISFREFIPIRYYELDFIQALDKWNNTSQGEKIYYLEQFKDMFKKNNRKYFPKLKIGWRTVENINNYGTKLKEYIIPLEEELQNIDQPQSLETKFEEEPTTGYRERTIKNASADATIAIAVDFTSAGEILTKNSVLNQGKKYISIDANKLEVTPERIKGVINALNSVNAKTLNIAGNGIYTMKNKYTQEQVDAFTYELLKAVTESTDLKNKIELIRSGGQTGFDEAGIKAGIKLGIPTLVLAPKGWTFRVDLERFNNQYRDKVQNYKINNNNSVDISDEGQFKDRFKERVDSIIKISKPTKSKKLEYSLFNKALNKNQTKSGYKLTIPEFPNAEIYITNESYNEEGNTKRKKWEIEVMSKGTVMTFPTEFATTIDEVINKFTDDINEKYSKKQETLSVLKEIGIDLQKNEESDGTDQLPEKC